MGRYKNVFLLFGMLIMAVFIGSVVLVIANTMVDQDNKGIAADTSGVTVQIMNASDERFTVNMVNSSQYDVDCLDGNFLLQRRDGSGDWQTVAVASGSDAESGITYELPSGQNRAFWFDPVQEPGGKTVLEEGEYRLCKDIHRDMYDSNSSIYEDLTLTTEFSYPQILSETRGFGKPVEQEEYAAKLARTVMPWLEGMTDYWNPYVAEEGEGWRVDFPMKKDGAASEQTVWVVYVSRADGSTRGPECMVMSDEAQK